MGKKYNIDPTTAPYGAYFLYGVIPATVNVGGMCNAYYHPGIYGFYFGDENSCGAGAPDLVLDNDVVRHEYTHAIMHWFGFTEQFGDEPNRYGRAMGEGNADFGAFLATPKDPYIGEVAFYPTYLRNLDNTRMYPYDVDYPAWGRPEEHYTGEIWGGYLYDLYRVLKGKAPWYVGNAYYYFTPAGGHWAGHPDFFDGILAQVYAEFDATGKYTNTIKAWGSMASRGINGWLLPRYSHVSDYFGTGAPGGDERPSPVFFTFPPFKTIKTKGNCLLNTDIHEYPFITYNSGKLTVQVTGKTGGALDPWIRLFRADGSALTGWIIPNPSTPNKCLLTYEGLPPGEYVIHVQPLNSAPARGYYDITISLK